ncbi:MAG: FKBP-type peptidyl-prolyl cis-trans isomerase [Burkholderiaceae bacterium]
MSNLPHSIVAAGSYLTLHYRVASLDGQNIISTFEERPATLQLGTGQLAPPLEQCLIGLPEGAHQVFELPAGEAFGMRNPELVQRISRTLFAEQSGETDEYEIGDLVEFNAPGGGRFAGVLRELASEYAVFDFNHPLAGQAVKFEVKIIGVL